MLKAINSLNKQHRFGRTLVFAASIMSMLLLASCISSSRVYNNDKNVVYNDAMYNLANVKQIKATVKGKLSDSETVDLTNADRDKIEAYLDEYNSIYVRMSFQFDDQEMLYRASQVDSWSQYSKMKKSLDRAGKDIGNLMANKKKIQLKLK